MQTQQQHKLRFVTSTALFDGHDASINMFRRLIQQSGAEVIHLGHNRSVQEIVKACLEEDVQGVLVSSYQGGHMEFFKYLHDLLKENGRADIRIFGGGGGGFGVLLITTVGPNVREKGGCCCCCSSIVNDFTNDSICWV